MRFRIAAETGNRRIEAAFRQNMMDQIAVQAAVAVRERVNIDEREGEDGGGKNGVQIRRGLAVERDQPLDQGRMRGRRSSSSRSIGLRPASPMALLQR